MRARLPSPPCPPAELPIPQTSTLRSRRRLANILVIAGFVFMACWSPHVICLIFREFSITSGCSNTVTEFVLLLGTLKMLHKKEDDKCQVFVENFRSKKKLLILLPFFSLNRICSFSRITNSSLDSQLQFITSICLPTIRKAQFSPTIFTISFTFYWATAATAK